MTMRMFVALCLAIFVLLASPSAAIAQTDCKCNCYFSFDCPVGGQSCSYADLFAEDNCWFRSPKPQGNPGAGCNADYFQWGRCDGLCNPPARNHMVVNESKDNVVEGVRLWHDAMIDAALNGGGVVSTDWMKRVGKIEFTDPDTSYNLWRAAVEIIVLTRGLDAVIFPADDVSMFYTVEMAPLDRDSPALHNSGLALQAVFAEMESTGSGRQYIDQMDPAGFDHEFLDRLCADAPDQLTCLHWRLGAIADVLKQAGRGTAGGGDDARGGTPCRGCLADCVPNDAVDVNDLFLLLADWDRTDAPVTDLNDSGRVDIFDLFLLLDSWGACVPPAPN